MGLLFSFFMYLYSSTLEEKDFITEIYCEDNSNPYFRVKTNLLGLLYKTCVVHECEDMSFFIQLFYLILV